MRCPHCATIVPLEDAEIGADGRMVRCSACGTRWLARVLVTDPYARPAKVQRMTEADRGGDALVIDHVPVAFARQTRRKVPPLLPPPTAKPRNYTWAKVLGGVAVAVVAVFLLRGPILAALPAAAGLPDQSTLLEFQDVTSETVDAGGAAALLVEGTIVNRSANPVALPAIRITLRAANGDAVTSWLVEPAVDGLAGGASIGFRSALATPPPDAAKVTLNLVDREGA